MSETEPQSDDAVPEPGVEASDEAPEGGSNSAEERAAGRSRTPRPYPNIPFMQATELAEAIWRFAAGERVRRLTLLRQMDRSPTSSTTRYLIINSGKYAITTGNYNAEWLSLTDLGKAATNPTGDPRAKRLAQFKLAIEGVTQFKQLYEEYSGKRLPAHEVLKDVLRGGSTPDEDIGELVDAFVVNAKDLGLLQTIAGAETLLTIDHVLDELHNADTVAEPAARSVPTRLPVPDPTGGRIAVLPGSTAWDKICFYITPIGDEGTETRDHADLFLNSLIAPALREFDLEVVRADRIGAGGMITSQIIEHVLRSRLAIADLSWHNPNAFYEMALRHASKRPLIQICRKQDRLPFDVNQVRTIIVDTSSIYTLVPRLETYRSEIATQVRLALSDPQSAANPLSIFFPGLQVVIPDA